MSSNAGAGFGANAKNISLNLSTAVPTKVFAVKSVNRPSEYEPSSGGPIDAVTEAMPEESWFNNRPGPNLNVDMELTDVEPDVAVIEPPPEAIVIVSDPATVVIVTLEPAANVKVSV